MRAAAAKVCLALGVCLAIVCATTHGADAARSETVNHSPSPSATSPPSPNATGSPVVKLAEPYDYRKGSLATSAADPALWRFINSPAFNNGVAPSPTYAEQIWRDFPFPGQNDAYYDEWITNSAFQQPLAPLQPLQPVQPQTLSPLEPTTPTDFDVFGTGSIAELAAAVGGGPAQSVGQLQAETIAPTDLGGLLQSSISVQSVNTTRRSPVALDPNIRGYKFGQIFTQANGAYWFPVREDLDSMLAKIDPGMIQDVVVIPGPYGLRYGPGFSFIDIIVQDTPRYQHGPESHVRLNGNQRTNGGQFYGRATAYGGGENYGYRISYGHRRGSDYEAGNDLLIPSSYNNRDVWAQFGFSTSPYQRVEASYLWLGQTDTEYAAQFFDVDGLDTNGTTLRAVDEDPMSPWTKCVVEGWYNTTDFTGSITPSKRLARFPVIQRVEYSLDQEIGGRNTVNGNTLGYNISSGARATLLYGELDDRYLRTGVDFHYWGQRLRENYDVTNTIQPLSLGRFSTNQPRGRLADEGIFTEYGTPLVDGWNVAIGARVDFVETRADPLDVRPDTNLDVDELTQNDTLYAYYITNQLELDDALTFNFGYGYAQRPPTLTERYADGVFLGLLQSGFTRVIGDAALKPERDFQLDCGLTFDYENFRGGAGWFYAWVVDYSTFQGDTVVEFFDARLVRYRNTPLATLTGFETVGEWDWSNNLSPFGKMKYVQGTDVAIDGPLPAIPPLEGTVGIRLHDNPRERNWEFEWGWRIVDAQDRLGEILLVGVPTVIEERTPGFYTSYIRAFYNWTDNLTLVGGIDNLFNRTYQEHLDLRLLGPDGFPAPPTRVLSPGITPYFGLDWTF